MSIQLFADPAGVGTFVRLTPEDYGAQRDGRSVTDAAITNATATLTSATAAFTSADVGKYVKVRGAGTGGNGGELVTTISAVTNATTVTLAASASATVTGARATLGTDDAAAIESAIGDAVTQAVAAKTYYAEVVFSPGLYVVARAAQHGGTPYFGNAQIRLPVVSENEQKVILVLKGGDDSATFAHWLQDVPQRAGPVLYSMLVGGTSDATYGAPSCIGGPTKSDQGGDFAAGFSNMLLRIQGLTIVAPKNPSLTGLDAGRIAQLHVASLAVLSDQTPAEMSATPPTNSLGLGLRVPYIGNNHYVLIDSLAVEGVYYGCTLTDHFIAIRLVFVYTVVAMFCSASGTEEHGISIVNCGIEATDTAIEISGGTDGSLPIWIGQLNLEVSGSTTFIDAANYLHGEIHITQNNDTAPTVSGAGNVAIIDDNRERGNATAPDMPATTVVLVNPFYRDAAVHIVGGTVTAIKVDTVATGITAGMVMVPTGKGISITYSVAPTWVWTLL